MAHVVVIGAGVSGLTTALLLARKNIVVTIVARHMPGDYDMDYASPWAGANFLPASTDKTSQWERATWPELQKLAEQVPEAGIHFQKARLYRRDQDMNGSEHLKDPLFDKDPWFKSVMPDYKELALQELPPGYQSGSEFTSVCINTATYLQWLLGQCLKLGIKVKRATLTHIYQAKALSHTGLPAAVIINTSGLGSAKLGGVEDTTMYPSRGQIVLVHDECHPMLALSGNNDEAVDRAYCMQRAGGGGTIIGGTYDIGNWNANPDPNVANRILKRFAGLFPQVVKAGGIQGFDIVRHGVGLRPCREDGVRLEKEKLDGSTWVIHNYGHGGWGYQGSYGCAAQVVKLFEEVGRDGSLPSKL